MTSKLEIQRLPCQVPWRYRDIAGTGWPGVSTLGEVESSICNFYLGVAARGLV